MHEDMTAILKCYTEEAVSKSRKNPGAGKKNKRKQNNQRPQAGDKTTEVQLESDNRGCEPIRDSGRGRLLSSISDEELLKEIVRRKASSFRLSGAMKRIDETDDDPIGDSKTIACNNSTS